MILPTMQRVIDEVRLNFKDSDFFGKTQRAIDNRTMLDRLEAKIRYECCNEQKILIDSQTQCLKFQGQELNPNGTVARDGAAAKHNAKGAYNEQPRCPPAPTVLTDIEISLRPNSETVAQYKGKSGAETRC